MSTKALVCDVDGTLADTEQAHRVAVHLAFQRCRLGWAWKPDTCPELLKLTGGKARRAHCIDRLDVSACERRRLSMTVANIHAEKTRCYGAFVADGALPLRDGVAPLRDEALAAGCELAIASTTTAVNIDALPQPPPGPHGQGIFMAIAGGDPVPAEKPAPDIYRLALRRLDVRAAQALAFEDSPHGLRTAASAGVRNVAGLLPTPGACARPTPHGSATG